MFLNVFTDVISKIQGVLSFDIMTYIALGEAVIVLAVLIVLLIKLFKKLKANHDYKKQFVILQKKSEYERMKASFSKDHPNAAPAAKKEEEPVVKKNQPKTESDKIAELEAEIKDQKKEIDELENEVILAEEDKKLDSEKIESLTLENERLRKELEAYKMYEDTGVMPIVTQVQVEPVEEKYADEPVLESVVEEEPALDEVEENLEEEAEEEEIEEEAIDYSDDDEIEEEAEEEIEEPVVEEEPVEVEKEAAIEVQEYVALDSEGQPKKIKRKFNIKMMFAPYETKRYYSEVKNYLMSYRAKGRISSRNETFRYKGIVAKVVLGGKVLKCYLALDPAIINQYPKYHLKDFGYKKQFQDVPVMIKVRSERSLKYFKELVDLMFESRLIKQNKKYEEQNFIPSLIPNGEAILANLGMESYYLQSSMNPSGIPKEMPDDLLDYLPCIPGDELDGEEVEAVAYLDTLCRYFNDGDVITLDVLKSMHICHQGNILRIKARGTLDHKLIIYAEKFDDDALKMLMCTSGTAIRIVRNIEE